MPVDRAYITPYAITDSDLYQALTQLANFSDALESAAGIQVGPGRTSSSAPAPAAASWQIEAANGHYLIQIVNPVPAGNGLQAALQSQVASATSLAFDANSATTTYTLGIGQTTLDVIDPNVAKYWRLRSRYAGSGWNAWLTYANASGVAALNAGALKTS